MILKFQKEFVFTCSSRFRMTDGLLANHMRKQTFLCGVPRERLNSDTITQLLNANKKVVKNQPQTEQETACEKVNSTLTEHIGKKTFLVSDVPRKKSNSETLTKLIKANKTVVKSPTNIKVETKMRCDNDEISEQNKTGYISRLNAISKESESAGISEFNTSKTLERFEDIILSRNRSDNNSDPVAVSKKQEAIFHKGRYNMFDQTIDIFRNIPDKYPFIRLSPPPRTGGNRLVSNMEKENVNKMFWLKFAAMTGDKDDLLDAWQLVSKDTISSCSEVDQTILDFFVQSLCKKLASLSYQELTSVLFHLSLFYEDQGELRLLSSLLDQQLATSLKNKLGNPHLSSEDISSYLKVAFIWRKQHMASGHYKDVGIHNSVLVHALLTKHIHLLTPQQTVFSLFLCGFQRRYPGCSEASSSGQGWPLPPALADKLGVVLNEVSHPEVGVVCHALHQTGLYILTEHRVIRSTIIKNLLEFPVADIQKNELSVGSLAKILKKRGSEHHTDVMKVMEKYRPHLHGLRPYTKLRLLQFILPGKPLEPEGFLKDFCDSVEHDLSSMRVKDLEQLAFCLYFLSYEDSSSPNIYQKISQALLNCSWSSEKSGLSIVFLISHLAKVGVYDLDIMDIIFKEVNKCQILDLDTDEGLALALGFLFKLNIPIHRNVTHKRLLLFIKRNRALCRSSLLNVVELDCIREMHQLPTEAKLNPEARSTITEYFHRNTSTDIIQEHGRIDGENFLDQSRKFVYRDLSIILGGQKFIRIQHAFPFSAYEDLFFALDKSGDPVDISEEMFPKGDLSWRGVGDGWRVVVVPPKNLITWDGHILGPVKYKINNLERFGYEPTVLHWPEYYRALREKKNLSFLRSKLKIKR